MEVGGQTGFLQLESNCLPLARFRVIGFTMSMLIAALAFKDADFPAAKIAIFIASFAAAASGTIILRRQDKNGQQAATPRYTS